MAWVGRTLKHHMIPTHLPWAGTTSTRSSCSEPHPTFESFQQWGIHNFSAQRVLESHHLHIGNCFPISNLNLPSFSFNPILLHPIITWLCKQSLSIFLLGSLQVTGGLQLGNPKALFSRLNNSNSPVSSLQLIKHYGQSCFPILCTHIIAIVSTLQFSTHKNGM